MSGKNAEPLHAPPGYAPERELVLNRVLNAPRELVFDVWTDPDHIRQWWGPNGFTTTMHEMSVKPAGAWRFIMHGPDGTDYPNRIVYREVVRPERLVYFHDSDKDNDPAGFLVTVTFEDLGDRTLLTMRLLVASAADRLAKVRFGAIEGGSQTVDRLQAHLAALQNPQGNGP